MRMSPIEYLIAMVSAAAPMVLCARLFRTTSYRGTMSAVGLLFGMMVVELVAVARYGDSYPVSIGWVIMRTVLGAGFALLGDYLFHRSRLHEVAGAAAGGVGIIAAYALFH